MARTASWHGAEVAALLSFFALVGATPARAKDEAATEATGSETMAVAEAAAADGPAGPNGVVARVTQGAEGYEVDGRFTVTAPRSVVWEVLTDYDSISRFVSSMRESRVVERGPDEVWVEQEAVGRLFLFKRRLRTTLRVQEVPPETIRFEDVLHKDFESYRGEWRIAGNDREIEVTYQVVARPAASVPGFVARGMFQRTVHQLLTELAKEITTRAAVAERQTPERSRP